MLAAFSMVCTRRRKGSARSLARRVAPQPGGDRHNRSLNPDLLQPRQIEQQSSEIPHRISRAPARDEVILAPSPAGDIPSRAIKPALAAAFVEKPELGRDHRVLDQRPICHGEDAGTSEPRRNANLDAIERTRLRRQAGRRGSWPGRRTSFANGTSKSPRPDRERLTARIFRAERQCRGRGNRGRRPAAGSLAISCIGLLPFGRYRAGDPSRRPGCAPQAIAAPTNDAAASQH